MKLSVLFDKNGFMTLVNMRSDRKEQTVYRIALRLFLTLIVFLIIFCFSEPESLKHLSLFAVKRLYPNMFKMTVEERLAHRLPPCLPIHPLFDHMESDNSQFHSVKSRFSNFMKKVFSLQWRIFNLNSLTVSVFIQQSNKQYSLPYYIEG